MKEKLYTFLISNTNYAIVLTEVVSVLFVSIYN